MLELDVSRLAAHIALDESSIALVITDRRLLFNHRLPHQFRALLPSQKSGRRSRLSSP